MANDVSIFDSTFTKDDFTSVATGITNGGYTLIYKSKVTAKQLLAWGAGLVKNGVDQRETISMTFQDSGSANLDGWVRIGIADPNEANRRFVKEFLASDLRAGKKLGLRSDLVVGEDAYLIVEMKSNSATKTIDTTKTVMSVPITKQLITAFR